MKAYAFRFMFLALLAACNGPELEKKIISSAFVTTEIFPLQNLHTHGATIVELPNGDLRTLFAGVRTRQILGSPICATMVLHVVYSYTSPRTEEGKQESIKYARLGLGWIKIGS